MMTRSGSSSGDHPEDGPKVKYPCGVCGGEAKAGSIQCGVCPKRHRLACVKVPASVLPFIQTGKNKVEGLMWNCKSCRANLAAKSTEPNEDLKNENETLVAKVAQMKEELVAFKQSVENYETNEAALMNKVRVSEENLKKQQKTFAEAGNPDFDNIMKMEECMRKELVQIGETIKDSLVKEIQNNNKMMEEKFMSHRQPLVPAKNSHTDNPWNQVPQAVDFRTILQ